MTAPVAHRELLDRLASDSSGWTRAERVRALRELERMRSWLDAREAALLGVAHREADDVDSGARDLAQLCQQIGKVGYGDAKRRTRRAHRFPQLPATERALAAGRLGSAQADVMCELVERLEPDQMASLVEHEATLVSELHELTPAQARRRLARFEQDLQDDDGTSKHERQRAKNSHRERKHGDGTSTFFTHLDPVAASQVRACIDHKVEQLWRSEHTDHDGPVPRGALSDERLRAQAMVELIRAGHAAAASAQRAAARAVHDTCCIDGCDTLFDYCQLHHVDWWGSGGRSDLANLARPPVRPQPTRVGQ